MPDLTPQLPVIPLDVQGIALRNAALKEAEARQQDRVLEQQAAAEQRRILSEVAKTPLIQDPQTGAWMPDRNALMQKFGGMIPEPLRKILDESDTHIANVHKAQEASLSDGAKRVVASGNDADVWKQTLDYWEQNHVLSATEAKHYRSLTDPEQIGTVAAQLAGQQQKPGEGDFTLGNGRFKAGASTPYATAPEVADKTKPIFNVSADKGTLKQIGEVPANAQVFQQPQPAVPASQGGAADDPKAIAEAIARGDQPPDFTGLYRMTGPVRAELARMGYDLTKAEQDWKATQKYFQTLNGAQQIRLRQAVSFTKDSLDIVQDLANQWDGGKFPLLNKAQLAIAKGGGLGPQAQAIATKLDAQISDIVSELGTVYKGGNSSTDETLKLAAKNLQSDWSKATMTSAIELIRKNLAIRENSIKNTTAVANQGNEYAPQTQTPPPARPAGVPASAVWVPDPTVPGGGYWKAGG